MSGAIAPRYFLAPGGPLDMHPDFGASAALALFVLLIAVGAAALWRSIRNSGDPLHIFILRRLNWLYAKTWHRWSATGGDPLPPTGPVLLVSNHTSCADPVFLQCGIHRKIAYMMAREFLDLRWAAWLFRVVGIIPVNRNGRDSAATRAALRALDRGGVLAVFPEGRINTNGSGLLPGHPGAAMLALHSRARVVPVCITGGPRTGDLGPSFLKRSKVRVHYGQPIDLSAYYGRERDRDVLQAITDMFMREIARLGRMAQPDAQQAEPTAPSRDPATARRRLRNPARETAEPMAAATPAAPPSLDGPS